MMKKSVLIRILLPLLVLPATGCPFRSHQVERARISNAVLHTASASQLVDRINREAHEIKTLNATVDIDTSVGGGKTGRVTEYQEIRGYILLRQPGLLRMIGLMPVVRTRAFDMVSRGAEFELYIPPKSKLYARKYRTQLILPMAMRPQRQEIIYNALLLDGIDPQDNIDVVENGTEMATDPKSHKNVAQPDYRLDAIHRERAMFCTVRFISTAPICSRGGSGCLTARAKSSAIFATISGSSPEAKTMVSDGDRDMASGGGVPHYHRLSEARLE